MQRRFDAGYRQFESTPSTRPAGAAPSSSQAPSYPQFESQPSAMLAAPARPQPFLDPAAARRALPSLSPFHPQAGPQYSPSVDLSSTAHRPGAHYAPPHDYYAHGGYQSFPPPPVGPSGPLRFGEASGAPISDSRLSPASRGPPHNPLKRPYEAAAANERLYPDFPSSAYMQHPEPGEPSTGFSSTPVSSISTSSTPSYPALGMGPGSSGPVAGTVSPSAARCVLHLRQQPRAARAGPDGKDRRPIDPPPVLQLMMTGYDPASPSDVEEMQSQFVVHCRLISASSPRRDVSTLTSLGEDGSREIQRLLLGTSVSSPFHTKDDPDVENAPHHPSSTERAAGASSPSLRFFAPASSGVSADSPRASRSALGPNLPATFFIFADLSVRKAGEYRLEFSLMKMDPHFLSVGEKLPILHKIASQPFRVVNAKDFDQVQPSTVLVKGLIERGAGFPLKLKKGTREGGRRRTARDDDDSRSEDDEGG